MGQIALSQIKNFVVSKGAQKEIRQIENEVNAELERAKRRYRPDSIEELILRTSFSKRELQLLYRGFKEGCPNGIVTLEKFHEIFSYLFPYGDATDYASCVFLSFDVDKNGELSFEEFVMALSILSRGTSEERLKWVFKLYDPELKGYITEDDILRITKAMYALIGSNVTPKVTEHTAVEHAKIIFQIHDKNNDGEISMEEFVETCNTDSTIRKSMNLLRFVNTRSELVALQEDDDKNDLLPVSRRDRRRKSSSVRPDQVLMFNNPTRSDTPQLITKSRYDSLCESTIQIHPQILTAQQDIYRVITTGQIPTPPPKPENQVWNRTQVPWITRGEHGSQNIPSVPPPTCSFDSMSLKYPLMESSSEGAFSIQEKLSDVGSSNSSTDTISYRNIGYKLSP